MHPAQPTDAPLSRISSRSHFCSHGVDPFQRTSASRAEKPGAYYTHGTPSGMGVFPWEDGFLDKAGIEVYCLII
jgi:hypothetical protein